MRKAFPDLCQPLFLSSRDPCGPEAWDYPHTSWLMVLPKIPYVLPLLPAGVTAWRSSTSFSVLVDRLKRPFYVEQDDGVHDLNSSLSPDALDGFQTLFLSPGRSACSVWIFGLRNNPTHSPFEELRWSTNPKHTTVLYSSKSNLTLTCRMLTLTTCEYGTKIDMKNPPCAFRNAITHKDRRVLLSYPFRKEDIRFMDFAWNCSWLLMTG